MFGESTGRLLCSLFAVVDKRMGLPLLLTAGFTGCVDQTNVGILPVQPGYCHIDEGGTGYLHRLTGSAMELSDGNH